MQLYPHQQDAVAKALPVLAATRVVYLIMEVRTGKTITSLTIAKEYFKGINDNAVVGFITKKKAIPSIIADYKAGGFDRYFTMVCINYERIADMPPCDLWIIDEAHSCGQYPKPSQRTKALKEQIGGAPCILLSGTPTPESYSQIYHQLWITGNSPFDHKNFYIWARDGYVDIRQKIINAFRINDYSRANADRINYMCGHLFVSCSQQDAGFTSEVQETMVGTVSNDVARYLYHNIQKDKVCEWSGKTFIADTPANMLNKMSQIAGGTLIADGDTEGVIFDDSKAVYIRDHYAGKRKAIYYRYKAELKVLESFFPHHTQDWTSFESGTYDVFLSQIQSGREGISLRSADLIIMYNIDFSATSYWQVRARMQHRDRREAAQVVWLFSDLGIESKVYEAVSKKKNFTVSYYQASIKKHVRKQSTAKNKELPEPSRVAGSEDHHMLPAWMAGSDGHEEWTADHHRSESSGRETVAFATGTTQPIETGWF